MVAHHLSPLDILFTFSILLLKKILSNLKIVDNFLNGIKVQVKQKRVTPFSYCFLAKKLASNPWTESEAVHFPIFAIKI